MNYLIDTQEINRALDWLSRYWDKASSPEYYPARSVDEAVRLIEEYGKEAKVLAGGVDILSLMKSKIISPNIFIDIKNIPGLRYIRESEDGLSCGTLTLVSDMQRSDLVKSRYPILYEAASLIASPQVRNMATIGGNLLQEVRCWYYRRSPDTGMTFNCRRKIDSGRCYAPDGENQYHAILNADKCFAVNPSDLASALLALDARVNTAGISGGRSIHVDDLYRPLGNALETGEIITSVQIPNLTSGTRQRFLKFRIRKAIDFAIVSVALVMKLDKGIVEDIRIVLGGVANKPWRVLKAEELLKGDRINESLAARAARTALREAAPLAKNSYKVKIAETLVKRAILSSL